jgi:phosphatidylserine/phosphatidylglycerophosphate/cardiolipin synthase-like enzyme
MLLVIPAFSADQQNKNIEVFFSPLGVCTEGVTGALGRATNTIYVQSYSFTSTPIAKALLDAHKRGVKVQVILDIPHDDRKYLH